MTAGLLGCGVWCACVLGETAMLVIALLLTALHALTLRQFDVFARLFNVLFDWAYRLDRPRQDAAAKVRAMRSRRHDH